MIGDIAYIIIQLRTLCSQFFLQTPNIRKKSLKRLLTQSINTTLCEMPYGSECPGFDLELHKDDIIACVIKVSI